MRFARSVILSLLANRSWLTLAAVLIGLGDVSILASDGRFAELNIGGVLLLGVHRLVLLAMGLAFKRVLVWG